MIITFSINEMGVELQAIVKFSLILSSFTMICFRHQIIDIRQSMNNKSCSTACKTKILLDRSCSINPESE